MRIKNTYFLFVFIAGLVMMNSVYAGNLTTPGGNLAALNETPAEVLLPNQQVRLGDFSMKITQLEDPSGRAATGRGEVFVPFLNRTLEVSFAQISVNVLGNLMDGEVVAMTADREMPTYQASRREVRDFLQFAATNQQLPLLLNSQMEAQGMNLGGYDFVMTRMTMTKESADYDATFIVPNPDGHVTTFSRENLPVKNGQLKFCNMSFPLDGPDQTLTDPEFPIVIKRFNAADGTGTYVAFDCDGFKEFKLVAEYHFDPNKIRLQTPGALQDTVVATFTAMITTWGQFMANVTFNGPFKIGGVDDVIVTMLKASIDYTDSSNPQSDSLNAYISRIPAYGTSQATRNTWRGFFIDSVSVQLPASLAVGGGRITLRAKNLIFDRPRGLTVGLSVTGAPIIGGFLEGWAIKVDTVQLNVLYNSPQKFEIKGKIRVPVMTEELAYAAKFTFPTSGSGTTAGTPAEIQFGLIFPANAVFTVPLLKNAQMSLANSVAGFKYTTNKFTPYANFNGSFSLDFSSGSGAPPGKPVAGDFKFPSLSFQGFTLNYLYDVLNPQNGGSVIPETGTASGGLKNINFYAFAFAGKTFVVSAPSTSTASTSTASTATATGGETTGGAPPPQKIKGFPIAVKNIGFSQYISGTDTLKKLDFTIAINFTNPSVGLSASASLAILGKLNMGKLLSLTPWEALDFHSLQLNAITIGTQQQPVNLGGISLYGGLLCINKDPVYGDGFKGFLSMSVEPGITVDVVGQFGTISKTDGSLNYRYWFADAKVTFKSGIRLGPAPVAVYGFGGGAYYNMQQSAIPAGSSLDVNTTTAPMTIPTGGEFTMGGNLMNPGQGLSCTYTPLNNTFGVKATVVLGTHPKANTANMDLTLQVEFNTSPFGLKKVSLLGAVYMMADIDDRANAKIKGTTSIVYDHTGKTLMINGTISVAVKAGTTNILTGGGSFAIFFNLNPGQSSDWYLAVGAPPIAKRMALQFNFGTTVTLEGYFVAGNINRLPPDQRTLPRLREYDPLLQQFEGQGNLTFDQLMNGNAFLMGARYAYSANKRYGCFGVDIGFTVGFDALLFKPNYYCTCCNPMGMDGWYINGQIYGALRGSLNIRVNLLFHKGTYNIASVTAAALVTAQLPNPTWMKAQVAGSYRILGGLVKGSFNLSVEIGDKCTPVGNNLDPGDVVAAIKVIGDVAPVAGTTEIPVYREKLVVTSFLEPINKLMDFSEESADGLMVMPVINSINLSGPVPPQGYWKYGSGTSSAVIFSSLEYISTKLLQPLGHYYFTIRVSWKKKTTANPNWTDVILKNQAGQDSVQYFETKTIDFYAANRPTTLPPDAVLASYPDHRAINYAINENPTGGGIALKMQGWGYLFNPKKRGKDLVSPQCDPDVFEYNYYARLVDKATGLTVSEKPLTAVPIPEWNQNVGDPQYIRCTPCRSTNPFLNWIYSYFNISCDTLGQGACAVLQPSQAAAISNVKNMPYSWSFGGTAKNFDLAVSQGASATDKSIGFPDFSDVLQKGKVYTIQLVGHPIVPEETYSVSTAQNSFPTVQTGNGSYTVTNTTQAIQTQFAGVASERVLYQYDFGTSEFNTFVEKLGYADPTLRLDTAWRLNIGHDTLFNFLDFKVTASDYLGGAYSPYIYSGWYAQFPIRYSQDIYRYNQYITNYTVDLSSLQYQLNGINEGFDAYELARLSFRAQYDWDSGYVKYLSTEKARYQVYEKTNTAPFDGSVIPKGPYVFMFNPTNVRLQLNANEIVKPVAVKIELRFYPRTTSIYKMMKMEDLTLSNNCWYCFGLTNYTNFNYNLEYNMSNLKRYGELEYEYGDLFRLKYTKGTTANLAFNKSGVTSGSYSDYSGEYYIRNIGSGRYLQEAATSLVSTLVQANDNYHRFILARQSNGSYTIKCKATNRFLGKTVTDIKGFVAQQSFFLTMQPDGSFKMQTSDQSPVFENSDSKMIQNGTGGYSDYDRFTLETAWQTPPADLNNAFRIKCVASGRYLYSGTAVAGEMITAKKENMGAEAQFRLRRREDGFYDITASGGRRIHAEQSGNTWIYTTRSQSGLEESHYLFELIRQPDSSYYFKNVKTGEYLFENFDIDFGPQHRFLLGSANMPTDAYSRFLLTDPNQYVTPPQDLSGQYLLRNAGSGRFLNDNDQVISTLTQEDEDGARFILKKTSATTYEIWNKATGRRMHLESADGSRYSTLSANIANAEFQFTFTYNSGDTTYTITKAGSAQPLFERFDFSFGSQHHYLQSVAISTETDYARFRLLQERDGEGNSFGNKFAVSQDYSGLYFLKTKGSGRILDPGLVTTAPPSFGQITPTFNMIIIKKRQGAYYEIWTKQGTRLHPVSNSATDFTFTGVEADPGNYLFNFIPENDALRMVHKNTGKILYEHFEPGSANDKKLGGSTSPGAHYINFLLQEGSSTIADYSGTYYIRSRNSNLYWQDSNGSDNQPSFGTNANWNVDRTRFTIQKNASGYYMMADPWNIPVIFPTTITENAGWLNFPTTFSLLGGGMSIVTNPDESVSFKFTYYKLFFGERYRWLNEANNTISFGTSTLSNSFFLIPAPASGAAAVPDISAEYRIQVQGSGQYLNTSSSGTILSGAVDNPYLLQRQSDNIYAIVNKVTNQKIHAAQGVAGTWIYTTVAATDLPEQYYQFRILSQGGGLYTIQCVANSEYLYENFELNVNAPAHRQLLSAVEDKGEYARFYLKTTFSAPPPNLSGEYLLKVKGSNRYLHCAGIANGGLLTTKSQIDDGNLRFVLKRRASGEYEIWSKAGGVRIHRSVNAPFTINQTSDTLDANYRFAFALQSDGFYEISNFGNKLFEFSDPVQTDKFRQIWSIGTPQADYQRFALATSYVSPNDLSGEYLLRAQGSGRHLVNAGGELRTTSTVSNDQVRFQLEKQSDGTYKIKSKADNSYLHLMSDGSFVTTLVTGLPAENYKFTLENYNNLYRLRCIGNNQYLYEKFDLLAGIQHRQILSSVTPDLDYSIFSLESEYTPPPRDLSGDYLINVTASDRNFLNNNTAAITTTWPTADADNLHFILKRRATGKYEIWSKQNLQRYINMLTASTVYVLWFPTTIFNSSLVTSTAPPSNGNEQFDFIQLADGSFQIKNYLNQFLDETPQATLTGSSNNSETFRLETSFSAPPTLSGEYHLKIRGSNRHVLIDNGNLATSWSAADDRVRFVFELQTNGAFRIKSLLNNQYLHLESAGGFSTNVATNLPAANYEFNIVEQTAGIYTIQCRANSQFLIEYFDVAGGTLHHRILSSSVQNDDYNLFELEKTHVAAATEIPESCFLQVKGSELYLNETANGTIKSSSNYINFVLKRRSGEEYEIWNKSNQKRMHLDGSGFSTAATSSLLEDHYRFTLVPVTGGFYQLKCKANNQFLYENFDLNNAVENARILASADPKGDDAQFKILAQYVAPTADMSGAYLINVPNYTQYFKENSTGDIAISSDQAWLVLRKRAGGYYEVWSRSSQKRIHWQTGAGVGASTVDAPTLANDYYLFSLIPSGTNFQFKCKANNLLLASTSPTTNAYRLINEVATSTYHILVQGSRRHLYLDGNNLSTSWDVNDNRVNFSLEKQAAGDYKLKSISNNQYFHLDSDGGFSTAVVAGLPANNYSFNLILQQDGVYKIQCAANGQYLYEFFDVLSGALNHKILSSAEAKDDYSYFLLETTHVAPGTEVNGEFLVQIKNNEQYVNERSDGQAIRGALQQWFVFKPRSGGYFEIWSKSNQRRLHWVGSGLGFSWADTIQLNENSYLYSLEQAGEHYRVKSKITGMYLFENFDLNFGSQNGILKSTSPAPGDDALFKLLKQYVVPPTLLNGKYLVRNKGSEYYMNENTDGTIKSGNQQQWYALKYRTGGYYEIWSVANQRRLHWQDGNNFTTAVSPSLAEDNYLFSLIPAGDHYQIKCKVNSQFLFENYDMNNGANNGRILGSATAQGDDAQFKLMTQFTAPPVSLFTTAVTMRLTDTERYVFNQGSAGLISTETPPRDSLVIRYVMRWRPGGTYEIWNKATQKRLHANANGIYSTSDTTGLGDDFYRFSMVSTGLNYYIKCKGNNEFLYEDFNPNRAPMQCLKGNLTATTVVSVFKISNSFSLHAPEMSGLYVIRRTNGSNYWNCSSNIYAVDCIFSTTPNKFYLRWMAGGLYEIWSKEKNTRLVPSEIQTGNYIWSPSYTYLTWQPFTDLPKSRYLYNFTVFGTSTTGGVVTTSGMITHTESAKYLYGDSPSIFLATQWADNYSLIKQ